MDEKKKPSVGKPPLTFGKPETGDPLRTALIWSIIILAVLAILLMVQESPREKNLACDSSGHVPLNAFGSCHEE